MQEPASVNVKIKAEDRCRGEKWKAEKHTPETKEKGTGHVQAAEGEQIGWGEWDCLNEVARMKAAVDDEQREREMEGDRGEEGRRNWLWMWDGIGGWRRGRKEDKGT